MRDYLELARFDGSQILIPEENIEEIRAMDNDTYQVTTSTGSTYIAEHLKLFTLDEWIHEWT